MQIAVVKGKVKHVADNKLLTGILLILSQSYSAWCKFGPAAYCGGPWLNAKVSQPYRRMYLTLVENILSLVFRENYIESHTGCKALNA